MNVTAGRVLDGLDRIRGDVEQSYRTLHQHPELSHQEERTAQQVADRLRQDGFEVTTGVGGTGVVGVLRNGDGPCVLLRADMDALPVLETTGLPYASTATATNDGTEVPVMHACGHDVHIACLLGAARLLANAPDAWHGTLIALFQPAEETSDGAQGMVGDGLVDRLPKVDVALAQHVMPFPAGGVGTHAGPALTSAESMRIVLHGRGAHGSMPQASVDPVVLAAAIVLRLQAVVSREIAPTETAVLTIGSIRAGTKSNVIPDSAELQLNLRTYSDAVLQTMEAAIRRIVAAECEASAAPRPAEFEVFDRYPVTSNDTATTERVAAAFAEQFGDRAGPAPQQTASEDFSDIPKALGVPFTFWFIGGTDPDLYANAEQAGRVGQDIPVNHSSDFATVLQPTLDTGVEALVVAALSWLAE